ncbi:hypothetical protein DEU56DRAFT_797764 [Suillus clintonianus]|uniref:uncharacterized protein n=1 Tax=Suillus clintonianus TaxID=1904413 RepID=UPI001B879475|nr:uncharacterized protein DEU56DRAFT_797764 [Suillus clintonianus]KAG2140621.1 hypothetical protein DEU56DRAFT_797764 [Suillus clintonianus]
MFSSLTPFDAVIVFASQHLFPVTTRTSSTLTRHSTRVSIPIGGSTKGTTLAYGEWGARIKGMDIRFRAKKACNC